MLLFVVLFCTIHYLYYDIFTHLLNFSGAFSFLIFTSVHGYCDEPNWVNTFFSNASKVAICAEKQRHKEGSHFRKRWVYWLQKHCSVGKRVPQWCPSHCCQTGLLKCRSLHQNQNRCWWRKLLVDWMYWFQTDRPLERAGTDWKTFIYKSWEGYFLY